MKAYPIVFVLIIIASVGIHEAVHIVQAGIDGRVSFDRLEILDGNYLAAVYVNWENGITQAQMRAWNNEQPIREFMAYSIQTLFAISFIRFLAIKKSILQYRNPFKAA